MADFKQSDPSSLYGPQLVGAKVRELLKGKYEVIPKTKEHIKVDRDRCVGMACQLCYITCPTGSFEMEDGKAVWKYGMELCGSVVPVATCVRCVPSIGLTRRPAPALC